MHGWKVDDMRFIVGQRALDADGKLLGLGDIEIEIETDESSAFASFTALIVVSSVFAVMPAYTKFTQIGEDTGKRRLKAVGGENSPARPPPPLRRDRAPYGAQTTATPTVGNAAANGTPNLLNAQGFDPARSGGKAREDQPDGVSGPSNSPRMTQQHESGASGDNCLELLTGAQPRRFACVRR